MVNPTIAEIIIQKFKSKLLKIKADIPELKAAQKTEIEFIIGITIQRFGIIGNVIIPYFKSEERKLFNYIKPFEGEVINIDIPFDNFNKLKQLREDALQSGLLQNSIYVSCKIK